MDTYFWLCNIEHDESSLNFTHSLYYFKSVITRAFLGVVARIAWNSAIKASSSSLQAASGKKLIRILQEPWNSLLIMTEHVITQASIVISKQLWVSCFVPTGQTWLDNRGGLPADSCISPIFFFNIFTSLCTLKRQNLNIWNSLASEHSGIMRRRERQRRDWISVVGGW